MAAAPAGRRLRSRRALLLVALLAGVVAGAAAPARAAAPPRVPAAKLDFSGVGLCEEAGGGQAVRVCYQRKLLALIEASRDPANALPQVDLYAHSVGGVLD